MRSLLSRLTTICALIDSSRMELKRIARQIAPQTYEALVHLTGRGYYSRGVAANKCLFIHIPKTAGLSIRRLVPGSNRGHITWRVYYRANPKKFETFFKFSFVRNPWDRVVSAYWFLEQGGFGVQNPGSGKCDDEERAFMMGNTKSFEEFVIERLPRCLDLVHFRPQHQFIFDDQRVNRMDFTGRYENIAEDYGKVCAKLGVEAALRHLNTSRHDHYTSYYSPETYNIVGDLYADDIALLGY